jgi:cytoskeletal protein CcmA (bactofilin family)
MFSKKPEPESEGAIPMARSSAPSSSTFSVIGADVTIKGDVSASTELHVDGRIEGDITCESLVQGETSVIEGAITAETARLAGRISGSITARHLVVLKSARVEGDVNYDALTIEQGAQVEGRFAHRAASNQRAADKPVAPVASDDGEPKLTLAT